MAEAQNGSMFGRKVFFLNPSYSVRTNIIPQLRELEFEVYAIDNYHLLKPILRHYPDSICFINIGFQMPLAAWYAYVESFSNDYTLGSITLGVFSDTLRDEERELFLNKASLPAGVIATHGSTTELVANFSDILTMNNAKGRRQYVRATCLSDKSASMLWIQDGKMYQMKLVDVSVAGAALMLPVQNKGLVQEKSVIRSATLRLGPKQHVVDFLVYAIHQKGDALLLVTLFLPNTAPATKTDIKEYINTSLQKEVMHSINGERTDETDYIERGREFLAEMKNAADIKRKEEELAKKEA